MSKAVHGLLVHFYLYQNAVEDKEETSLQFFTTFFLCLHELISILLPCGNEVMFGRAGVRAGKKLRTQ